MSAFSQALALLGKEERRSAILLLLLLVGTAVFEVIGVASVMPFMLVLAEPNVVQRSGILSTAYEMLGFTQPQAFLSFLGLVVFVLLVCSIVFKAVATWALWRFTNARCHELTCRLLSGYLHQPYAWFLHRHSADLVKTSLSDVDRAVNGFLMPMFQGAAYATMSLLLFVLLLMVDATMAIGAAVVLGGIYVTVFMLLRRYLSRIGAERVRSNLERHKIAYEVFGGIKEIKAGVLEDAFLGRFLRPSMLYSRADTMAQLVTQLPRFALEAVAFGGLMLFLLHLINAAGSLQEALPTLAVYAFAGYRLIPALQQVYSNIAMMRFNAPAVIGVVQDLGQHDSGAGIPIRRRALPAPLGMQHSLMLSGIGFSYPRADRVALDGISIEVPVHSTIGIVGATGAGKTTMVDVLLGLLCPDRGHVVVDGVPLGADTLPRWQRTLGYVPQQISLTDDTIAANIAFGATEAEIDMHAVERAARIANLHEFVARDLPRGYLTMVGDNGVRLSGGQRQRIGIARALYHDPDVLLFDEATSALDNLTEQAVMEAVRTLGGRKTIIMIAHRLTTVRECDRIYVLERGAIDDQGTFEDLMSRSTRFRAMATSS